MDNVLKEKERLLLKNKNHIIRMSSNKKKVEMIRAYFSLLEYYQTISGKEEISEKLDIDLEFTEKYDQYIFSDTAKSIKELENNAKKLYDKFQKIIDVYKENEFCQYKYISLTKINKTKMGEAIWYFFDSLGKDVSNIYYQMLINGNIHLNCGIMDRMGYSLNSTPIDNACISIQNIPYYLDFYTTLAHEVGHCYQFYLQKDQRNFSAIDPYCEITSILFDKLFTEYLKNNHLLKDEVTVNLDNHIIFLTNVSISKALCKLLKDHKIGVVNPFTLEYSCTEDKDVIEKEIINDCGYVRPTHSEPDLSEIRYGIGSVIATHFFEKIKNDFENGWKEFKDFICTINYLPMEEVIEKYFNIPLVETNIKKLTKSYHER